MARMVTVTITYDMDDTEKLLTDELNDWLQGNVNVMDLFTSLADSPKLVSKDGSTITITE